MGRANSERFWMVGGVLGAIIILLISWFLLISPQLSDASSLKTQKSSAESSNAVLEGRITQLKSVNLDDLRKQLETARQALPSNSGLAEFTRQLQSEADASLVRVTSISAAPPIVVSGGATAPVTSGDVSPDGTAPATSGVPRTGNTSAAGKVFAIPVTIVVTGTPDRLQSLLQKIQAQGPRRALMTNTTFAPAGAGAAGGLTGGATMNAQMQVFVAPQSPAVEAELEKLATPAENK